MKERELRRSRATTTTPPWSRPPSRGRPTASRRSATIVNQIGVKNPARLFEPKVTITNFDLAIGVRKGEPRLVEKLNEWITDNLKNGKLNEIYKKFHGSRAAGKHAELTSPLRSNAERHRPGAAPNSNKRINSCASS